MPTMSPAMVVRLSVGVCARLVPDNYHVSELVDVSVATVLIDENHLHVPMTIVTRDMVILAAMAARLRGPTS